MQTEYDLPTILCKSQVPRALPTSQFSFECGSQMSFCRREVLNILYILLFSSSVKQEFIVERHSNVLG